MSDTTWMSRAACRDADPELFFPTAENGGGDGSVYAEQVAAAKAVCAGCPVQPTCLAFALERLPYGVAGGASESQRRAMRRNPAGGAR